jgi:hypothetical protein
VIVCVEIYTPKYTPVTHLFLLEHAIVEALLQALVCQVDAQLLKAVLFQILKAGNIEQADEGQALDAAAAKLAGSLTEESKSSMIHEQAT